ncbi:MAG TPA: prephenate dehydratase [Methanomassiliicoccales archaeon]|nr:prephenate dehydratase [Methanomassiliicoccales archaeon]
MAPIPKHKVAYQGLHGAYSEDAIIRYFGEDVELVPCTEFEEVFQKVESGEVTHAVLPIENSIEGSVTVVNDLLLDSDLTVTGEVLVAVRHCLISHPASELKDVRRVYSHPQALAQCRTFLARHPEWEKVPSFDTAGSVRMIKERGMKEEAAIASKRAAAFYGMKVLQEDIQSATSNFTRFFVLEKTAPIQAEGDRTSLVFSTKNIPGALYQCIGAFAQRGVNLSRLESRPRKGRTWEYVFYVDVDGHVNDPMVSEAIAELLRKSSFVKVFGSYKKAKPPTD